MHSIRTGIGAAVLVLLAGVTASAQSDEWQADLAPLYGWAASTDGNIAVNGATTIPVYLDFADAAKKLAGAFAFHGEVRSGRVGIIGDVYLIRLSSDTTYTVGAIAAPISGAFKLDQTVYNAKISFQITHAVPFFLVGGVRAMTMAPKASFTGPHGAQLTPIDISRTKAAGVGGFIYRPAFGRFVLLTQGDIGGGTAFTWTALGGLEFLIKPWVGLAGGYSAMRVDTGSVPTSGSTPVKELEFNVTQHGPLFALTFHLGRK